MSARSRRQAGGRGRLVCDVTDTAAVRAEIENLEKLDVLVNNAGSQPAADRGDRRGCCHLALSGALPGSPVRVGTADLPQAGGPPSPAGLGEQALPRRRGWRMRDVAAPETSGPHQCRNGVELVQQLLI